MQNYLPSQRHLLMNCEANLSPGERMKNPPLNTGKKDIYWARKSLFSSSLTTHSWNIRLYLNGPNSLPWANESDTAPITSLKPCLHEEPPRNSVFFSPSALSGALTDLSKPCKNNFVNLASTRKTAGFKLKSVERNEWENLVVFDLGGSSLSTADALSLID